MSAEIDSTSAPEPHKMSGTSSVTTTSGQKLSIFAAKSGFVIPKNKLSGSLVPIFRGAKKHGVTGAINEESSKQTERKSKWGPDLTQDATVRRGKALALQVFPGIFSNNTPLTFVLLCIFFSHSSIFISFKAFNSKVIFTFLYKFWLKCLFFITPYSFFFFFKF